MREKRNARILESARGRLVGFVDWSDACAEYSRNLEQPIFIHQATCNKNVHFNILTGNFIVGAE